MRDRAQMKSNEAYERWRSIPSKDHVKKGSELRWMNAWDRFRDAARTEAETRVDELLNGQALMFSLDEMDGFSK